MRRGAGADRGGLHIDIGVDIWLAIALGPDRPRLCHHVDAAHIVVASGAPAGCIMALANRLSLFNAEPAAGRADGFGTAMV